MVNGILGKKIGMTQLFDEKGEVHPVTVLQAGPCVITQLKRANKEGYEAAQIGLVEFVKGKNVTMPMKGHFAKHNLPPVKFIREVAVDNVEAGAPVEAPKEAEAVAEDESNNGNNSVKVGDKVLVDIFNSEKYVDVIGVSKGRGFAGVVRRHHFTAGRETHGTVTHKQPGSIGASAYPSRVIKGKRLPGRMGGERVTVKNLHVVGVDPEQNLIWIRGSIPGPPRSTVLIRKLG